MKAMIALALTVLMASPQTESLTGVVTKATFTETLRVETLTESGPGFSRTQTAQKGKWTLDFEVDGLKASPTADTEVILTIGSYTLSQKIGDDPDFGKDAKRATLHRLAPGTGSARPIEATAVLTWRGGKVRIRMEGKEPILGKDMADSGGRDFRAGTQVKGSIGALTFGASLMGLGKAKRQEASAGSMDGSVVEVSLTARLPKGLRVGG
jgi:hypothetical protein